MAVFPTSKILFHRRQPLLLLGFGLVYGLISLVNQLNFRTAALDLGITAQAVAALAHGRAPWATLQPAPAAATLGVAAVILSVVTPRALCLPG